MKVVGALNAVYAFVYVYAVYARSDSISYLIIDIVQLFISLNLVSSSTVTNIGSTSKLILFNILWISLEIIRYCKIYIYQFRLK